MPTSTASQFIEYKKLVAISSSQSSGKRSGSSSFSPRVSSVGLPLSEFLGSATYKPSPITSVVLPTTDYTIDLNVNVGTKTQEFTGNFPINPAQSFSFNVSNSSLSGYAITGFIIRVSVNDYTIKTNNVNIPSATNIVVSDLSFSNYFDITGNLPSTTTLPDVTITGMLNGGSIKSITFTYAPLVQGSKNAGMKV